jgi:hypothetical protein
MIAAAMSEAFLAATVVQSEPVAVAVGSRGFVTSGTSGFDHPAWREVAAYRSDLV